MSINRNIGLELAEKEKYEEAMLFFKKAAEAGDIAAINDSGAVFEREEKYKKAIMCYRMAMRHGYGIAAQNLGNLYEFGFGVEVNLKKAIYYYKKAIAMKYYPAYWKLSNAYLLGRGVKKNEKKAFELAKKGAELEKEDNAGCLTMLAYYYESGIGTEIDLKKAFQCYKEAAKSGEGQTLLNLGLCYLYGKGTKTNGKKGIKYVMDAVTLGESAAVLQMYYIYKNGEHVQKDMDLAKYWLWEATVNYQNLKGYLHLAEDNLVGDNINTNLATQAIARFVNEVNDWDVDELRMFNELMSEHPDAIDWEGIMASPKDYYAGEHPKRKEA